MQHQGAALGNGSELSSETTTDTDPVFRCHLQKIDSFSRVVSQRLQKRPPQTQTGAMDGRLRVLHG
jgi:hypothetical protein